jgi:phosphomannomutase
MELTLASTRWLGVDSVSARINPAIVRSYDLRGAVGRQLGLDDARELGLAYATVARREGRSRIAVGRDGRLSSPALEEALVEGLVAGGMHVHRIGIGPTPQMYFAVYTYGLDGGIMVTASHNPGDENGFKLLLGADPVHGVPLRALVATQPARAPGGRATEFPVAHAYVTRLADGMRGRALTVVWDCGNGAVGAVIKKLTARLPGRHFMLNASVDGRFPAHHPDPAVATNLRELRTAVVSHGADLGVAFDGDGDRIGLVDHTGAILWPDQLLLLLASEVLAGAPGSSIVADVKSSRVLFDGIARLGGRSVMAPSGYVLVRETMLRERAPLAGEMSGHILFADCWHGTDDALYVAIEVLNTISRQARNLAAFRLSLPSTAATPEMRLPCAEDRKAAVVREVAARLAAAGAQVDTTDGVRVTTADGWWLLRASGTEPKLTVRCEASDEHGLATLRRELMSQLLASGVECQLDGGPRRRTQPAPRS